MKPTLNPHLPAVPLLLGAALLVTPLAQAQYVVPWSSGSSLVMNSTFADSSSHPRQDPKANKACQTPQPDRGNTALTAIPPEVMRQLESTSMSVLGPEYQRRAGAQGEASAQQWLGEAAHSVGSQLGRLGPEYLRRAQDQGRAQADAWYIAQARDASQRQIAGQ